MTITLKHMVATAIIAIAAIAPAVARVAPTMPEPATLEAGQSYFLYNIGSLKFTYTSDYELYAGYNSADAVTIQSYDSKYSIRCNKSGYYWYSYGTWDLYYNGYLDNRTAFQINELGGSVYTIQNNDNLYVGLSSSTAERLSADNALSDLSKWLLLPDDSLTEHYIAKRHLFMVLEEADSTHRGYNLDKYETIYNDDTKTNSELHAAAYALTDALRLSSYLNWASDYPILFENDPNHKWGQYNGYICINTNDYGSNWYRSPYTMTLTATFVANQEAAIFYQPRFDEENRGNIQVFVDDELVRTIDGYSAYRSGWRYFESLSAGRHTVKWIYNKTSSNDDCYAYMNEVCVSTTPLVSVNTTAPGQLATEVLNFWPDTNHKIDEVRRLKVSGPINSQDFATIDMMPMLFDLDLSEADCKTIAANEFNRDTQYGGKSNKHYLYKLKLPNNLETIGEKAFRNSYIDDIELPATLKTIGVDAFMRSYIRKAIMPEGLQTIGHHAFYQCYALTEAVIPDSIQSLGEYAFEYCRNLKTCNLPKSLTKVPDRAFAICNQLNGLKIHEGIREVGYGAFYNCYNLENPGSPSTLEFVRPIAFYNCYKIDTLNLNEGMTIHDGAYQGTRIKHLVIPENCVLYNRAFSYNPAMETVEFPTTFYIVGNVYASYSTTSYGNRGYNNSSYSTNNSTHYPILENNSGLKTVTLKSPTMVNGSNYKSFLNGCGSPTIRVPKYLQNSAYRQDSYWYNYAIEGFSTADVESWTVNAPLTLNGNDRFEGSPNLTLNSTITINGDAAMVLNNVDLSNGSMVLSNCENIQVRDTLCMRITTTGNVWRYLSLPFNFKVSDIRPANGAYTALYYYDGARRAANNTASGNWVRLPQDTIVTAGTGFIYQTSKSETTYFYAVNDGEKGKVFGNDEYVRDLNFYDAESTANRGWNLVGNPYLCYYNLHKLSYTAPITVATSTWNSSYKRNDVTYKAYSLVDDDYAINPREAFFVQCGSAETSRMSMPVAGKQLTSVITDQTGARLSEPTRRHLMDITLSDSEERTDGTRVVFNPQALCDYEPTCDASKFMSTDAAMPQLFTLDNNGTAYAINERPEAEGCVAMGLLLPTAGSYTLSLSRTNKQLPVLLYDSELDLTTDLQQADYTFYSQAGTLTDRFVLFGQNGVTQIDEASSLADDAKQTEVFDLQGRRIGNGARRGIYVVRHNGHTQKISVK